MGQPRLVQFRDGYFSSVSPIQSPALLVDLTLGKAKKSTDVFSGFALGSIFEPLFRGTKIGESVREEGEREREREREMCECLFERGNVCVCERACKGVRERETERETNFL